MKKELLILEVSSEKMHDFQIQNAKRLIIKTNLHLLMERKLDVNTVIDIITLTKTVLIRHKRDLLLCQNG